MTWELLIPALAAGLSLVAIGLELLMHDREKAKKMELTIRKKQREIKELQKKKDTKAMMEANKELMGLMGQNMRLRMKTMMISMPLFLVVFWVLSGALALAPLSTTGATVGVELKNLDDSPQKITAELVSQDVTVRGENLNAFELDDKGDQGDRMQVWWEVTAAEGARSYNVKVTSDNKSDEKTYNVKFVPPGSLTADFSPGQASELLDESVGIIPIYRAVEINLFGIQIGWFIYYFVTYLVLGAVLSPLKNRVLWGHWKGIKHIEKIEREAADAKGAKEAKDTKETKEAKFQSKH